MLSSNKHSLESKRKRILPRLSCTRSIACLFECFIILKFAYLRHLSQHFCIQYTNLACLTFCCPFLSHYKFCSMRRDIRLFFVQEIPLSLFQKYRKYSSHSVAKLRITSLTSYYFEENLTRK